MTRILFLVFATAWFTTVIAQPKCELKSCKIVYEYFDGINTGYKTIIFTDSGLIDKQIIVSKIDTTKLPPEAKPMFQSGQESKQLKIQTYDSVFLIDLNSMKGYKSARLSLVLRAENPFIVKIGTDTFMQKQCDVYDARVSKIWYWKGVYLKKEIAFKEGITIYERAILIDENYLIQKDEFTIPEGVQF